MAAARGEAALNLPPERDQGAEEGSSGPHTRARMTLPSAAHRPSRAKTRDEQRRQRALEKAVARAEKQREAQGNRPSRLHSSRSPVQGFSPSPSPPRSPARIRRGSRHQISSSPSMSPEAIRNVMGDPLERTSRDHLYPRPILSKP